MGRTGRKRQKRKPCNGLDHEPAAVNLRKFLARNGFKKEINLTLRNFPETGRGLTTRKALHANDVIIRIPYDLMITLMTLEKSDFPQLFTSKLPIHDLLTAFLVIERHKKSSFWSYYIDSLPPKPPWLPALLQSEYIELLPADLRLAAGKSRKLMKESWLRLRKSIKREWTCSCCGKTADCVLDLNTFMWSYIMVNTRAVYVSPDTVQKLGKIDFLSDEPSMALCPYLDMFNHSREVKTKAELVLVDGNLVYQLTTLTSTKKYDQVFICYGAHSNAKLLTEYGFFIPDKNDYIPVPLEVINSVLRPKLSKYQYKFIRKHGLDKLSDLYISEDGPSFSLKAILFVVLEECRDFSSVIYSDSYPEHYLNQVGTFCERLLHNQMCYIDSILSHSPINEAPVLVDFLKYRKNLIKELCNNKQ